MKKAVLTLSLALVMMCAGCKSNETSSTTCDDIYTAFNFSENSSPTGGVTDYESQWIRFPDSTCLKSHDVCVVKYYVEDDVLYTSEKFHTVTLIYSNDKDNSMAYQNMIYFDKEQSPDKNGWYKIRINKDDIQRRPDTHISGIVLRSYIGNKYPQIVGKPHANANLFNSTKEIDTDNDRNELSPQLVKLYQIIK